LRNGVLAADLFVCESVALDVEEAFAVDISLINTCMIRNLGMSRFTIIVDEVQDLARQCLFPARLCQKRYIESF
jgi:hypothetical protein